MCNCLYCVTFGRLVYQVEIEGPDEDGFYCITCPFFPGCLSQGKSVEEAKENIKEAIALWLDNNRNESCIDVNVRVHRKYPDEEPYYHV